MIIIDSKAYPTIQAFLEDALIKQQAILDRTDEETLQALIDQYESNEILAEFNRSQTCHDLYRPCKCIVTARKPTRSKPITTNKEDIFFYYLTHKNKIATKFYSRTKANQKAIRKSFTKAAPTSSEQAMKLLSILIK